MQSYLELIEILIEFYFAIAIDLIANSMLRCKYKALLL